MRRIVQIIFLLVFQTAISQNSYVVQYTSLKDEIPFCISQINDCNFIALRIADEMFGYKQNSKLLKTNSIGVTIAEYSFSVSNNSYYSITNILPLNETEFITVARCKSETLPYAQIGIIKFNTTLQVIWEKKITLNTPSVGNQSAIVNTAGNIVIGAGINTEYPLAFSLFFVEIAQNGDFIRSNYLTNGNPNSTSIYSLMEINGQYKAFVNGFSAYVPHVGFSEILNLDLALNLTGIKVTPYCIEEYMTAEIIDNTSYCLAGRAYSGPTHYDVGIAKLTNTEDSIAYNHAGKPGNTVDYSGWMKCMSVANSNSIYTGGTGFDNGNFYNCYTTTKVLMLSNYDSLLNCRWTRFYGSDTACYTMSTIEATSDGGCVMGGMYYSPTHPENLLDAVIIKVDSTGLFTNLTEKQPVTSHEAIIYPNPGENFLTIQSGPQIVGAEFRMYDSKGCLVLETKINSTLEQIDAKDLPAGIYPWHIIDKGKIIEQGKWIRQ